MNAKWEYLQSMQILKGLALEILDMDEFERLNTLEIIVRIESEGGGSRLWLPIVKALLARPELVHRALDLVKREVADYTITPDSAFRHQA